MYIYEVFQSPFILYEARSFNHPGKKLKLKFRTVEIEGSTTAEEVFILSKKHFDDIVTQYKNHYFDNDQAKESSYRLYIGKLKDYEFNEYNVYSINYDNIKDKICNETKYYTNFEVEGDFNLFIDVSVTWWEDYNSDEEEDEKPILRSIIESECIVCYENKPNMLFTDCLHVCVCNGCDSKGRFTKCPMCRTKINNNKIRIT